LAPLVLKQTALDFGQGQERWHDEILSPPLPARNSLFLLLGFSLVFIIGHHGLAYVVTVPPGATNDQTPYPPCDRLEVILGKLIAGSTSGFGLSIAGLGHILLGFVASGGGGLRSGCYRS
jgi:hypothetical protein